MISERAKRINNIASGILLLIVAILVIFHLSYNLVFLQTLEMPPIGGGLTSNSGGASVSIEKATNIHWAFFIIFYLIALFVARMGIRQMQGKNMLWDTDKKQV